MSEPTPKVEWPGALNVLRALSGSPMYERTPITDAAEMEVLSRYNIEYQKDYGLMRATDEAATAWKLSRKLERTLAAQRTALLEIAKDCRENGMQGVANRIEEVVK